MLQTASLSVDSTMRRRVMNELNKEPTVLRASDVGKPLAGFRCQIGHPQRLDSSFEHRFDLNSLSNATLKTCEKHLPSELRTRTESPTSVRRNAPASGVEKVHPGGDADVKQQHRHSTVEKECQTTKSSVRHWKMKKEKIRRVKLSFGLRGKSICLTETVFLECSHAEGIKEHFRRKRAAEVFLRQHNALLLPELFLDNSAGLCVLGWILCCPCWTIGFSLRDRSPYHHGASSPPYRRRGDRCPQQSSDNTSPHCQSLHHADSVGSLADPCWPFDEILS